MEEVERYYRRYTQEKEIKPQVWVRIPIEGISGIASTSDIHDTADEMCASPEVCSKYNLRPRLGVQKIPSINTVETEGYVGNTIGLSETVSYSDKLIKKCWKY